MSNLPADKAIKHTRYSHLRERIVEHVFVGRILQTLWSRDIFDVEVLRSEFDAHGYDIVLSRGPVVRHIQLKTSTAKRPPNVSVPLALADKPSGCVVWINVPESLEAERYSYFWFGGKPGKRLPRIQDCDVPRRATHNKKGERPRRGMHRLVPYRRFKQLAFDQLIEKLFGPLRRSGRRSG